MTYMRAGQVVLAGNSSAFKIISWQATHPRTLYHDTITHPKCVCQLECEYVTLVFERDLY